MNFKKLFNNDKAVSPVIGVILMVAITVILAAAIGSSVFGEGTAESAPQANLDIKSTGIDTTKDPDVATIRIEHLGGDPIHFEKSDITKVTASLNGADSVTIEAKSIDVFGVGGVKKIPLSKDTTGVNAFTLEPKSGDTVNIKIIDVQTNQLICDKDIRL